MPATSHSAAHINMRTHRCRSAFTDACAGSHMGSSVLRFCGSLSRWSPGLRVVWAGSTTRAHFCRDPAVLPLHSAPAPRSALSCLVAESDYAQRLHRSLMAMLAPGKDRHAFAPRRATQSAPPKVPDGGRSAIRRTKEQHVGWNSRDDIGCHWKWRYLQHGGWLKAATSRLPVLPRLGGHDDGTPS